jgi:hypothetical protein
MDEELKERGIKKVLAEVARLDLNFALAPTRSLEIVIAKSIEAGYALAQEDETVLDPNQPWPSVKEVS